MRTKIFFDTEFTGLHQKTTLISIGFVSENNEKFYAEFTDYDESQIDGWVRENVITNLKFKEQENEMFDDNKDCYIVKGDSDYIVKHFNIWLHKFDKIEMWSDCLAYDWVLFCQLYGHAFNIPKNIYHIPFDLCTLMKIKGVDPDVNRENFCYGDTCRQEEYKKHNTLFDAEIIRACYIKLINM